jgi:hypothetical protein
MQLICLSPSCMAHHRFLSKRKRNEREAGRLSKGGLPVNIGKDRHQSTSIPPPPPPRPMPLLHTKGNTPSRPPPCPPLPPPPPFRGRSLFPTGKRLVKRRRTPAWTLNSPTRHPKIEGILACLDGIGLCLGYLP